VSAKQRATVGLFGAAGGTVGTFFALHGGEDPLTDPALLLGFLWGVRGLLRPAFPHLLLARLSRTH